MEEKLQSVYCGTFNVFGIDMKCHILSNGQRVIEEESMIKLFEAMKNGTCDLDNKQLENFVKWCKGK